MLAGSGETGARARPQRGRAGGAGAFTQKGKVLTEQDRTGFLARFAGSACYADER